MHEHAFRVENPTPLDGPDILYVHQRAYVQGYTNTNEPAMGAAKEALEAFVAGEFAERRGKYWVDQCTSNNTNVYVARLCCSDVVVGFGEASPHPTKLRS